MRLDVQLTRILGVDDDVAAALNAAGISRYEQVAETNIGTLVEILSAAGLPVHPIVETWPEQAEYLARGAGEELYEMQEALKARLGKQT